MDVFGKRERACLDVIPRGEHARAVVRDVAAARHRQNCVSGDPKREWDRKRPLSGPHGRVSGHNFVNI